MLIRMTATILVAGLLVSDIALAFGSRDSLRTIAAPIWTAYTRDRVARIAGKTSHYTRTVFQHDPKTVRYTVKGNVGTVSAKGIVLATTPTATKEQAKKSSWAFRRGAVLTLRFTWQAGRWRSGPVEWMSAGETTGKTGEDR